MAKLLLTAHGSTGDVIPFLRLGRMLVRQGHSVMLASTPNHRQRSVDWGVPFTAIGNDFGRQTLADMLDESSLGPAVRDRGLGGFAKHVLKPYLETAYPAFLALAQDYDLIVGHALALWAWPAAQLLEKPFVRLHYTPVDFPSAYYLPDGAPAPNLEKGRSAWKTAQLANRRFLVEPLREVYQRHGIPVPDQVIVDEPKPRDLHLLIVDPAWVDRAPDWPSNIVQTGFIEPEPDELGTPPPRVADFVENAAQPLLVIALGSVPNQDSTAIHAQFLPAAKRHGFRTLIIEGWQGPTGLSGKDVLSVANGLPDLDNHCARPGIGNSYDWIFERSDVVVHHGSTQTMADCVRAGVPQVVIPFGYYDHKDCAQRVKGMGCGTWIHPGELTQAAFDQSLDELMPDMPAFKQNARCIRDRLITDGKERCAAAIIKHTCQQALPLS